LYKFRGFIFLFIAVQFAISNVAIADNGYVTQLIKKAIASNMANSQEWRALLHYKPGGLFHKWESQTDDPAFFLSANGQYKPEDELVATIKAMAEPVTDVNQHPQCRFPARYYWLKQQLKIDPDRLHDVVCTDLNKWFDTIRPGSLTLVFPSAYINGPSSMFGHTLLRVNPDDYRKDSPLVAYALNYAANANETDSALVFAIKGMIGGYPGVFSIVPYYEKLNQYSDLENRDVWEYDLNFDQDEINQLMRHAWEVRHIRFDYYFFTENCAYHMLSLMEVARPGLELTKYFDIKAIPADTVRAVVDAGLVKNYGYRPSRTTILNKHASQMSVKDNALAIAISKGALSVNDAAVMNKPVNERAKIYEQSYDYDRFLATANPAQRDARAKTNWELLTARSKIQVAQTWSPVPVPTMRPDEGHKTSRIAYVAGRQDHSNLVSLYLRPAYHDVLDPPAGYSPGAQINFLDLHLDYFPVDNKLKLNRLTLINVLSLSPINNYFTPVSWGVNFGIERVASAHGPVNATGVSADGGYSLNLARDWLASFMLEADIRAARGYGRGYTAGAGAVANILHQSDIYSFKCEYKSLAYRYGEEANKAQFDLQLSYHLKRQASVRFGYVRQRYYDTYFGRTELGYYQYF